jgi:hypothetical protein
MSAQSPIENIPESSWFSVTDTLIEMLREGRERDRKAAQEKAEREKTRMVR